jgi:hypothetical protein
MRDVIMAGQLCDGKVQPELGPIAPTYQAPLLCEKTSRKYDSGVAEIERNMPLLKANYHLTCWLRSTLQAIIY